jgi:hypothetical protein
MKQSAAMILSGSLLLAFLFFSACSSSAPSCNDERTKLNAALAWKDAYANSWDVLSRRSGVQFIPRVDLDTKAIVSIENVRTLEYRKDIGTYICAGDLVMDVKDDVGAIHRKGDKVREPIIFKSELVLDKKGSFLVTLLR